MYNSLWAKRPKNIKRDSSLLCCKALRCTVVQMLTQEGMELSDATAAVSQINSDMQNIIGDPFLSLELHDVTIL